MLYLKLIIRALVFFLVLLIALRFLIIIINRAPGVIVGLSVIMIGIFSVALYKGSFSAIGLHTKKSIKLAILGSSIIFVFSTAILLFVE